MAKLSTVNAIPLMTSNTSPSGIASSNNIYNANYDAWKAFNGVISDTNQWETLANPINPYIAYEFTSPISIGAYEIFLRPSYLTQSPKDWTFEGSNNGTAWTVLDSRTNVTNWTTNGLKFEFNNNATFKIYRLLITSNNSNKVAITSFKMFELEFEKRAIINNSTTQKVYSLDNKTLIHLPSSSDKNIILHGIESGKEIKLDEEFNKMTYIKDTSEVLDEGKTFTHALNISNTKINKIIL